MSKMTQSFSVIKYRGWFVPIIKNHIIENVQLAPGRTPQRSHLQEAWLYYFLKEKNSVFG